MTGYEYPAPRSIGLCSTCENRSFCIYRAQRGFDAQYCDMFDTTGLSSLGVDRQRRPVASIAPAAGTQLPVTNTSPKGLCLNCEMLETCMLPRPTEGVWHCEEYQ